MKRWTVLLGFANFCLLAPLAAQRVPTPGDPAPPVAVKPEKPRPLGGDFEVRYADDSTMRLNLLDENVVLVTPYGQLQIPSKEIRRIEIGVRLTETEQKQLDTALTQLVGVDGKDREAAKATLAQFGPRALPYLRRLASRTQGEALAHVEQVLAEFKGDKKADEFHDRDLIYTEDSKFAGRLASPTFRIETFQFGELKLKATDVKVLAFGKLANLGGAVAENIPEIPNPGSLFNIPNVREMIGKTVAIRITARNNGGLWGTNVYTLDSDLSTAALHSGVLTNGQTGLVNIKFLPDPGFYTGSTQNGVTSAGFNQFPQGAFEIIKK